MQHLGGPAPGGGGVVERHAPALSPGAGAIEVEADGDREADLVAARELGGADAESARVSTTSPCAWASAAGDGDGGRVGQRPVIALERQLCLDLVAVVRRLAVNLRVA